MVNNPYIINMRIDAFWDRVKTRLKAQGIKQETAAKVMGLSPNRFRTWMSRGMIPPLTYAYMLSRFLNVSLEYLIDGKESGKDSA